MDFRRMAFIFCRWISPASLGWL